MKILCVCGAGFCRSVATASILNELGHHAVAKGDGSLSGEDPHRWSEEDVGWADAVVAFVPGAECVSNYARSCKSKLVFVIELEDKWGFPLKARESIKRLVMQHPALKLLRKKKCG